MSSFRTTTQGLARFDRRSVCGWLVALMLLACGDAFAQTAKPSPSTAPAKPAASPAPDGKTPPAPTVKVVPQKKRTPPRRNRAVTPTARRRARTGGFTPDPNAKWSVDKTEATHEPVWRNEKTLTWNFEIQNKGTADLRIRAKGG
jgi:pyruvate/2-oxoglutarate dehydrogenase complex dihydrolipoamide acyltransferase (E2) component